MYYVAILSDLNSPTNSGATFIACGNQYWISQLHDNSSIHFGMYNRCVEDDMLKFRLSIRIRKKGTEGTLNVALVLVSDPSFHKLLI